MDKDRKSPRPDKMHIWFERGFWRFLLPGDTDYYSCSTFQDVLIHGPMLYENIRKRR